MQPGLFANDPSATFDHPAMGVRYVPRFLGAARADALMRSLRDAVDWQASRRLMYDRMVDVPRLTASYSLDDPALPEGLGALGSELGGLLDTPFNSVGLNLYRDGRDSVAPHNDTLSELVAPHPIALVSLGGTRRMLVREKASAKNAIQLDLEPGSLLVMSHASQHTHVHGVPKQAGVDAPRISLAYRVRRRY